MAANHTTGGAKDRAKRHVVGRFLARVTKHHALVSRALLLGLGAFHALIDIAGLLVDRAQHTARLGVKHVLALRVSMREIIACDGLHVQIRMAFTSPAKMTCPVVTSVSHATLGSDQTPKIDQSRHR